MHIRDVQTNKQHAVPQNIMDVEFKLVGNLTMRQFIYLVVFGGGAYLAAITMVGIFKWPIVIFFVFMGLILAFLPVQERGMDEWVVNFFRAVYSPNQRVWRKQPAPPSVFSYQNLAMVKQELITLAPTSSRRKLEEYLEHQDKKLGLDELDILENEYIMKVRRAFATVEAPPAIAVSVDREFPAPAPALALAPQPIKETLEVTKAPRIQVPRPSEPILSPMTPDRHSGRRFTSLLPSQGHLVLPIRGEKVLETSENIEARESLHDKTEQLQKLLQQIKGDSNFTRVVSPDIKTEARDVVDKVREENKKLTEEIKKLKQDVMSDGGVHDKEKEILLDKLKAKQKRANDDYTSLQRQILELQGRLDVKDSEDVAGQVKVVPVQPVKIKPLTHSPNIISGVVRGISGELMQGIILLIKNSKGESVRALKTNPLGEFIITTPLPKGIYTVEVGSSPTDKQAFDIISVDVGGGIIPPINISGRVQ